jgi:hypothetical protein
MVAHRLAEIAFRRHRAQPTRVRGGGVCNVCAREYALLSLLRRRWRQMRPSAAATARCARFTRYTVPRVRPKGFAIGVCVGGGSFGDSSPRIIAAGSQFIKSARGQHLPSRVYLSRSALPPPLFSPVPFMRTRQRSCARARWNPSRTRVTDLTRVTGYAGFARDYRSPRCRTQMYAPPPPPRGRPKDTSRPLVLHSPPLPQRLPDRSRRTRRCAGTLRGHREYKFTDPVRLVPEPCHFRPCRSELS